MSELEWVRLQELREWCEIQNAYAYLDSHVIRENTAWSIANTAWDARRRLFKREESILRDANNG